MLKEVGSSVANHMHSEFSYKQSIVVGACATTAALKQIYVALRCVALFCATYMIKKMSENHDDADDR
jgi:hypothetical protein